MARRKSFRSQLYRAARDMGNIEAAAKALAARVRSLKEAARHGLSRREVAP